MRNTEEKQVILDQHFEMGLCMCVCHKQCSQSRVMCDISADLLSIACRYSMCRALALVAPAVAATEGSRSVA